MSQEVPKVRFWGQSIPISGSSLRSKHFHTPHVYKSSGCSTSSAEAAGHPHTELYRRLADSSSVGDGGGETSRCRPRSYETVGVETKRQESVLSPVQRTTYLGVVVEFDMMQARMSPARIESIFTSVKRVREGQSLTVKQFQRLLGLMAAASNVIPVGLLYMRPLQWWLKTKGFSPRGNPLHIIRVSRRCVRALDMWRKPWFLNQGPVLGAPCRQLSLATDVSLTGWGAVMSGRSARGPVEWSPSHMAHQLSRDVSGLSSTKIFPPRPERSPCVGAHRQHSGGLLHQPPGGSALAPVVQTGTPDPLVVPGQVPLTESTIYSWVPECGTRRTVETGAEARGMDASPRGGEADMENILSGGGGPLRNSSECAMSPLVLSSSSSSPGTGRYGTDLAEATSVRFSPDRSAPRSSDESTPRRCSPTVSSPVLAGPSMVLGPDFLLDDSPWEVPIRRDLLSQAGGAILHPRPELWKLWVWPLRGHSS